MRRVILSFAIASVMAGGAAYAGSDNHATPGTPGDKNCVGQTMAFLAQSTAAGGPGIGNVASTNGLSVQEVKAIVDSFCNP